MYRVIRTISNYSTRENKLPYPCICILVYMYLHCIYCTMYIVCIIIPCTLYILLILPHYNKLRHSCVPTLFIQLFLLYKKKPTYILLLVITHTCVCFDNNYLINCSKQFTSNLLIYTDNIIDFIIQVPIYYIKFIMPLYQTSNHFMYLQVYYQLNFIVFALMFYCLVHTKKIKKFIKIKIILLWLAVQTELSVSGKHYYTFMGRHFLTTYNTEQTKL